jgi:glyoxylase-like metal-dependent hydrolase (beta-lactamase superfamily II)
LADGEAVLVDPCLEPAEIEELVARARSAGGGIHLLVTHGDFDHVCGIGYVPEASVVTGASTAARITSGVAGDQLANAGREWGLDWPTELRADRVVEPGRFDCGRFAVEALDATGHTADGLAFVLIDQGVLLPGDYLSPMTYPFVGAGLDATIATTRRLLDALETHDLRWVVPGHGRPMTPDEASAIGEADVAYLESLARAAAGTRERDLPDGPALLRVYEVEPPRSTTADFEIYALRAANARAALAHA